MAQYTFVEQFLLLGVCGIASWQFHRLLISLNMSKSLFPSESVAATIAAKPPTDANKTIDVAMAAIRFLESARGPVSDSSCSGREAPAALCNIHAIGPTVHGPFGWRMSESEVHPAAASSVDGKSFSFKGLSSPSPQSSAAASSNFASLNLRFTIRGVREPLSG